MKPVSSIHSGEATVVPAQDAVHGRRKTSHRSAALLFCPILAFLLCFEFLSTARGDGCKQYDCFDESPTAQCENDSILAILPCDDADAQLLKDLLCQGKIRLVSTYGGWIYAKKLAEVRTHDADWLGAMFPVSCSGPAGNNLTEVTDSRSSAPPPTPLIRESGLAATRVIVSRVGSLRLTRQVSNYTADDSFYDNYHVTSDLEQRWMDMASRSDRVRLEVIGQSWEGHNITMIRIGQTDSKSPKRVLVNGLQHAREWAAVMGVTYFSDKMTDQVSKPVNSTPASGVTRSNRYKRSTAVREFERVLNTTLFRSHASARETVSDLLRNVEVLVIPLANPDGYNYSRTDRFWRKNRRPAKNGSGCVGVDLNRNWPLHYGFEGWTSSNPCSDVFIGYGALTEPESSALSKVFANTTGTDTSGIVGHLDVHTYSGLILGPWQYSETVKPPGRDAWNEFGSMLAKKIASSPSKSQYRYGTGDAGLLYTASGVMSDWSYSRGVALSATLELEPLSSNDGAAAGLSLGKSGFELAPGAELRTALESASAAGVGLLEAAFGGTAPGNHSRRLGGVIAAAVVGGLVLLGAAVGVALGVARHLRKHGSGALEPTARAANEGES